jgi:hypothetical protein
MFQQALWALGCTLFFGVSLVAEDKLSEQTFREIALIESLHARIVTKSMKVAGDTGSVLKQLDEFRLTLSQARGSQEEALERNTRIAQQLYTLLRESAAQEGFELMPLTVIVSFDGIDQTNALITQLENTLAQWGLRNGIAYRMTRAMQTRLSSYYDTVLPWLMIPAIAYTGAQAQVLMKALYLSDVTTTALSSAFIAPTVKLLSEEWLKNSYIETHLRTPLTDCGKKVVAFITGAPIPPNATPIKKASVSLDMIAGIPTATKLLLQGFANYYTHCSQHRSKACELGWGLIFEGGDSTRNIEVAQGLAQLMGCGFTMMHASLFVKTKIADKLKELESYAPCIVVINDMDWLVRNSGVGSAERMEIMSNFINGLPKYIASTSNKHMLIVLNMTNKEVLDPSLRRLFAASITIPATSEDNVCAELKNWTDTTYGITLDQQLVHGLAELAHRESVDRAKSCIKQAFAIAQAKSLPFGQEHVQLMLSTQS